MKSFFTIVSIVTASLGWMSSVRAGLLQVQYPTGGLDIPDGDMNGRLDRRVIAGVDGIITDVNVTLDIRGAGVEGGWNGDIFAALQHNSGYSVLLNRAGRLGGNEFGSSGNGFVVSLDDSTARGDIHMHSHLWSSLLLGTWNTDRREVGPTDPAANFDGAPRTRGLDVFNGLELAGDWNLLVIDASSGGTMKLFGWGLDIEYTPKTHGSPVPDASGVWAAVLAFLSMAACRWKLPLQMPTR